MPATWKFPQKNTFGFGKFCDGEDIDFADDKSRQFWKRLHFKKCKICEEGSKYNRRGLHIDFQQIIVKNAIH